MTDDELYRPAEDDAAGGDLIAHEATHVVQSGGVAPADASDDGGKDPGDQVPDVIESAAELGLGAVIAPFTGGETVNIVGSVASMFEAGFDRLTHLGEHETPPEDARKDDAPDEAGDARDPLEQPRRPVQFGFTLKPDHTLERTLALPRQAEAAGFSHGWLFESHVLWR